MIVNRFYSGIRCVIVNLKFYILYFCFHSILQLDSCILHLDFWLNSQWDSLYSSKPDENYEDPVDVAMIKTAKENMGDYKLKTAEDYIVPEHLRMNTDKKRHQLLELRCLVWFFFLIIRTFLSETLSAVMFPTSFYQYLLIPNIILSIFIDVSNTCGIAFFVVQHRKLTFNRYVYQGLKRVTLKFRFGRCFKAKNQWWEY